MGSKDLEALNRPRDSRELIVDKMVEDLDFAIANLSSTKSAYEVTKWTAMALKSRILLFEGTFRKYHAGDPTLATLPADAKNYKWYLDECAKVSAEFIQTSGYGLHSGNVNTSYHELFTTMNATDLMDEVVLARDYNKAYGAIHSSGNTMTVGSMGCPAMTRKLVASYLMKDGSRFTDKEGWETMQFQQETQDRDPRLAQSIRTPGYKRMGEETPTAPDLKVSFTGYHPDKYVTTTDQDTYNNSDIDLIIFRAAEVMLNYAEAAEELGMLTQDIWDKTIGQLRKVHGGISSSPFPGSGSYRKDNWLRDYYTKDVMHPATLSDAALEIRRERATELMFEEGHRYDDLMRWNMGDILERRYNHIGWRGIYISQEEAKSGFDFAGKHYTVSTAKATSETNYKITKAADKNYTLSNGSYGYLIYNYKLQWDEKMYLYPIPTTAANVNPNLGQNEGWQWN